MDLLRYYLTKIFSITEGDWEIVRPHFQEVELLKNEFFIEQGKICKNSGFIVEGAMRYFTYDEHGNDPTCYFSFENHYVVDPFTFHSQTPSGISLQAVTPCKLILLTYENDKKLRSIFDRWEVITSKMLLEVSVEFANQKELVTLSAAKRYEYFVEKYPTLAMRVPLKYIASYLGIAQPSLSRLRKSNH